MLWGQSNADGRGLITDISAAPLSSDPELATFAADPFSRVRIWNGNAYVSLELGVNNGGLNPAPGSGTQFGPEFGLAVRWMRETSSGTLYIDKLGVSGASITAFNPEPTYDNYQLMQTERAQANSWLASNGGVVIEQEAHVWVQGETDRLETQEWYQTRMQAIIDAAISDGWWSTTDIQLLFQMGTTSTLYGAGVAAAKAAIAAASPTYIKAPPSPNYYGDGYHQNARGQVQLGYDAFALIFGASTITV